MGGPSAGGRLWIAGLVACLFAVLGCRYEANPRGGDVKCAANTKKRCPDGYACYWTSSTAGCIETCWPTTPQGPPQCGMDASQGNDASGLDLQGSGGTGGSVVATGGAGTGGSLGGGGSSATGGSGGRPESGGAGGTIVATGGANPGSGGRGSGGNGTGGLGSGGRASTGGVPGSGGTGIGGAGSAATGGGGGSDGCPTGMQSCPNGFACSTGACKIACSNDIDCASTHFCGQSSCRRRAIQIESYFSGACAILNNGAAWCWGGNQYGNVGDGTISTSSPYGVSKATNPVVLPLGDNAVSIRGGNSHNCVLLASGVVYCWGANGLGQLGDGSTTSSAIPVKVQGLPLPAKWIAVGQTQFTCAVLTDGSAWCWGAGYGGQLGDGILHPQTEGMPTPAKVMGAGNLRSIEAGNAHACALTVPGAVLCWGANPQGQVGVGTSPPAPEDKYVPMARPTGLTSGATTISLGGYHSCALMNSNAIKCWGTNDWGQVGNGTFVNTSSPVDVMGLTFPPLEIEGGQYSHTCAVLTDRTVWCWGAVAGAISGADPAPSEKSAVPIRATLLPSNAVSKISLGSSHACALYQNGSVWCWGSNQQGQLGNGTFTGGATPVPVIGW
jgi:alpha-tubulin suppressor-like RCC1 family protein